MDHPGFRFHQPDQADSCREVLGDLDVARRCKAVRWRDHFDGEIGGEGPVTYRDARRWNARTQARRRRPGRALYRDPSPG